MANRVGVREHATAAVQSMVALKDVHKHAGGAIAHEYGRAKRGYSRHVAPRARVGSAMVDSLARNFDRGTTKLREAVDSHDNIFGKLGSTAIHVPILAGRTVLGPIAEGVAVFGSGKTLAEQEEIASARRHPLVEKYVMAPVRKQVSKFI